MKNTLFVLIALLTAFSAESAESMSASKIFSALQDDFNGVRSPATATANGYIVGIYEATESTNDYCAPDDVTLIQLKQTVFNTMKGSRFLLEQPANLVILFSFAQAWPCTKPAK